MTGVKKNFVQTLNLIWLRILYRFSSFGEKGCQLFFCQIYVDKRDPTFTYHCFVIKNEASDGPDVVSKKTSNKGAILLAGAGLYRYLGTTRCMYLDRYSTGYPNSNRPDLLVCQIPARRGGPPGAWQAGWWGRGRRGQSRGMRGSRKGPPLRSPSHLLGPCNMDLSRKK